jgi:hypothetical protein
MNNFFVAAAATAMHAVGATATASSGQNRTRKAANEQDVSAA